MAIHSDRKEVTDTILRSPVFTRLLKLSSLRDCLYDGRSVQ